MKVTIAGRITTTTTIAATFSFESMGSQGKALNLGETVILPDEVNRFRYILEQYGITISTLHNH